MSLIGLIQSISKPQPWVKDALCSQIGDGDLWYPEHGNTARAARSVCAACPVRGECLSYALDNEPRWGIYGGFNADERESLRRGRNPMRRGRPPGRRGHSRTCLCVVCRRSA